MFLSYKKLREVFQYLVQSHAWLFREQAEEGSGPFFCLKQQKSLISIPLDATSQMSLDTITVLGCFVVVLLCGFGLLPCLFNRVFFVRTTGALRCQQVVAPAGVSIKEFKQAMKDPALHAVFDALEISAGAAKR